MKHINLEKHFILIEETNAKNHKARCATITREITGMVAPLLERYRDKDYYLFGTGRQIFPGPSPARNNYFAKNWGQDEA